MSVELSEDGRVLSTESVESASSTESRLQRAETLTYLVQLRNNIHVRAECFTDLLDCREY